MKIQTFYKIASIGLFAIFATMVTPSTIFSTSDGTALTMYGMADIIQKDSTGNVVFQQSIHNQITNQGEQYLMQQVFGAVTENTNTDPITYGSDYASGTTGTNIASICASNYHRAIDSSQIEDFDAISISASSSDSYVGTLEHCKTDDDVTYANGIATIGPLRFSSDVLVSTRTNAPNGSITFLLVCEAGSTTQCATTLFAIVDSADIILTDGSSADITYQFDITTNET